MARILDPGRRGRRKVMRELQVFSDIGTADTNRPRRWGFGVSCKRELLACYCDGTESTGSPLTFNWGFAQTLGARHLIIRRRIREGFNIVNQRLRVIN
jgi:hypothetical protein